MVDMYGIHPVLFWLLVIIAIPVIARLIFVLLALITGLIILIIGGCYEMYDRYIKK